MYHVYQTTGWILGSVNVGEANRFLDIFTSELGLVRGMAQGVRKLNSKLRYGLQDYSFSRVSFVKGKHFWRIVNAERVNDFNWVYKDKRKFKLLCRVFSLLQRLIKGEEKDAVIFNDINQAIVLMEDGSLSEDLLLAMEIILVFRILHKQGYVGQDDRFNYLAEFSAWEDELLNMNHATKAALLKQINSSLAHSHL